MKLSRIYRSVGGTVPESFVKSLGKKLNCAGIRTDPVEWIGARIILSLLIGAIIMFAYLNFQDPITKEISAIAIDVPTITINVKEFQLYVGDQTLLFNNEQIELMGNIALVVAVLASSFLLGMIITYLLLYFRINDRARGVEKILPDFLLLVVSNLRAGMTPFSAFSNAARPEFGEFHIEVERATAKIGGKGALDKALLEISNYFDSSVLKRTVSLFVKGIKSGGQLAKLFNSSAEEVRRIQDLRAELITSTRMYGIFLGFIVIIMMPFLLSVSTHFITMFLSIQEEIEIGGTGGGKLEDLPTLGGTILIDPQELFYISIFTLCLTSLLVSSLIGIISRGSAIYGIKYFPLFAIASTISFVIAKEMIGGMLSAFLGI